MQHEINNIRLTLISVQKDFEELKRKFLDQFSRLLATFISADGSLNRFMSSHIAIINSESFIQYPDAQLFASTKHQGEYVVIDETTHTITRRIDIKRNIDVCFDYRDTATNKKIQLPDKYETGAQILNELLTDSKYDYYQDYFNFNTDIDSISEIQQLYSTIATVSQFPNDYDSTIMFTYLNIILNLLQLKLLEKTDTTIINEEDEHGEDTEIFTGDSHNIYITGSTNIYLSPGEYQNFSVINSSSINLYPSYNVSILNSSSINIDKTLQHLIINNCKNIYTISSNSAYNLATHNTLSNIGFATQLEITGNYTLKNCKFVTAVIASKNINIDTTDVVYCNNCTNLTVYNCSTFNCTNLNNLSQKFTNTPNIFYNAQTTVNLQANSQLQTLWQGVSLNIDKINIIYPTTSCQNISINTTKQSQETNTKEINIVGEDIWGYNTNHQWSVIGSLQDANKKTYAVYNNNSYLTTIPINAEFDSVLTLNIEDSNIPGDFIEYQLINIYLPDDFFDKNDSIFILLNSSKKSNFSINKLQINNIKDDLTLLPNILYVNEETKQELYYEINILSLYGVKKNDGTEPKIEINHTDPEDLYLLNQTFYQYFNELYFYNCNVKILEPQVEYIQKLQNIQFVVDNLRSYDFDHENKFGGLFTNFKLNSISNPYVIEIPDYTFYNCEFTGTDLEFPATQIIGESAFETSQQFSQQKQYNFKFAKLTEIKRRAFKGRQIRTLSRDESTTMFVGDNAFIDTQIENINFINTTYSAQSTNIFNSSTLNILVDSAKFTQNIFRGTKNLNIYPIDYWFPHTYIQFPSSANVVTNLNIINTIYGNILAPTQIITTGVQSYVGNVDINDIFLGNNEETLITLSTTQNINIAAQTPINTPFIYANNTTKIMLMSKVQGIYLNKAILGANLIINSHHFFCKDLSYNGYTVTFSNTTPLINFNVSLYSHQTPTATQIDISFINAAQIVVDDITVINNLSSISGRGTQDITVFCKQSDEVAITAQHQYITTGKLIFEII